MGSRFTGSGGVAWMGEVMEVRLVDFFFLRSFLAKKSLSPDIWDVGIVGGMRKMRGSEIREEGVERWGGCGGGGGGRLVF